MTEKCNHCGMEMMRVGSRKIITGKSHKRILKETEFECPGCHSTRIRVTECE